MTAPTPPCSGSRAAWQQSRHQPRATERDQQQLEPVSKRDEQDASDPAANSGGGLNRLLLFGGLVTAAVVAGGVGGLRDKVQDLEDLIAASGYLGPLIYAGSYTVATVLLFPASILTLAAGYLFGPLKGTAVVSASSTAGACLSFLVSRYLARPLVEDKVAATPKFQAVYNNITADGAKLVLLLRLSPLVPFNLLNYGLGITQVRFLDYAWASWLGMLPGTFAYVYLGSVGKVAADATADVGAGAGGFDPVKVVLYVVGAIATVWATKLISTAASKAIDTEQSQQGGGKDSSDAPSS